MARSTYIYLIYQGSMLVSTHTVKHEAHTWLERSKWTPEETSLYRMRDGFDNEHKDGKPVTEIPWEFE